MTCRAALGLLELRSCSLVKVNAVDRSDEDSGPRHVVTTHRAIQRFILEKLDNRAAQESFQRAFKFVRKFAPQADYLVSTQQDLLRVEWVVPHAACLARRYTEFGDVLPSSAEWVALLLECACCELRKDGWQKAKDFLDVANCALEGLDHGVPGSAESDLARRAASMQSFIDEWGF